MLVFRKLLAQESGALKDHLLRLDEEDRRLRFGYVVTPEVILAYVDAIDWRRTWIVGAFEGEILRGVAQLNDSGTAGGTRLLEEALLIARNRGFESLYLLCLPENQRMQHVARKFAEQMRFQDGDVTVHIRSPQPDPLSYFAEMFGDAVAQWETAMDRVTSRIPSYPRNSSSGKYNTMPG